MPTPLLSTKLYIPSTRPNLVARPRLIQRMHQAMHGKLTLVSAPAGFGKTTLVTDWIADRAQPVWLVANVVRQSRRNAHRGGRHPLCGVLVDQAALYGVLKRINNLRLRLISVNARMKDQGETTMKAMYYTQYGSPDVLRLQEVDKPTPKDDEVLIKVHAAATNAYDWHIMRADPFLARLDRGLFKPKNNIPGADLAGVVEAVGKNVTEFWPGDAVYGDLSPCGDGAFAEYAVATTKVIAPKPVNLSFAEAAAVPMAALTALQALRDVAKVQPGQAVLINGASGGVGTFAVQIARVLGAEITAVCSTTKVDMVRDLGAHHVIDYKKADFTQGSTRYDVILAVNGYHPLSAYRRVLKPQGTYVMAGGSNRQIFDALLWGSFMSKGGQKMTHMTAHVSQPDLLYLTELIEAGKVKVVIDRCYPLSQTADAMRYLEEGHAKGKIVITLV